MKKTITILIALVFILCACEPNPETLRNAKVSGDACINQGGIPEFQNGWPNGYLGCDFPKEGKDCACTPCIDEPQDDYDDDYY